MAFYKSSRSKNEGQQSRFNQKKRVYFKRKVCRFCEDKELTIGYKDAKLLGYFITERGKIIPRRISGNCAYHQRVVRSAIKRARNISLLPYSVSHD